MRKLFFALLLLAGSMPVSAQDLFDFEHSLKFAQHLYRKGQYAFAAQEFDRLCFMQPSNDSLVYWKLKAVARGRLIEKYSFDSCRIQSSSLLSNEYACMLLLNRRYAQGLEFVKASKQFDQSCRSERIVEIHLLRAEWDNARKAAASAPLASKAASLLLLVENRPRHRSPALALALSALVPGAGKAYTGRYSDALSSFLLVAINAWQAHSGFNKLGNKSLYAWFFAGMGASFYLGNLYGSYRSALEFNQTENERFSIKAQNALFPDR